MDLKGQNALVLGALGRVGAAVARKLAQEGASVMISARRAKEGGEYAEKLRTEGYRVEFVPADATQRTQVIEAVQRTVKQFGRIDILANCFSAGYLRRFIEDTEEAWDELINVNYKGLMYACHAALQYMVPQEYGRIISLTSDSARIGATLESAQSGTKAAVVAFSKSLAREVARQNITVNVVGVGPTGAPSEAISPAGWEAFMRLIPLRRPGKPEEVAAAVAFLATPDASYITGQILSASGGLTMC